MRFHGVIGYGVSSETLPGHGKWEEVITEVTRSGDVIRNFMNPEPGNKVNDDLRVNNTISVLADDTLNEHFFNIKYVIWQGVRWKVTSVEVRHPRLLLYLGGVYNGPTP